MELGVELFCAFTGLAIFVGTVITIARELFLYYEKRQY